MSYISLCSYTRHTCLCFCSFTFPSKGSMFASFSKDFISQGKIICIFCYNDDITYDFTKSLTVRRNVPLHVINYGLTNKDSYHC